MLLFDAFHDVFRGVVCLVEVVDGTLRAGDRVTAASSGETYDVAEVRASRMRASQTSKGCGKGQAAHFVVQVCAKAFHVGGHSEDITASPCNLGVYARPSFPGNHAKSNCVISCTVCN